MDEATDPGGKLKIRLLGVAVRGVAPEAFTLRVTCMLVVPELVVTLTKPPCVPLESPVAFTETTRACGVVPAVGVTESQDPSASADTLNVAAAELEEVTNMFCDGGVGFADEAVKVS